ncbi:MAG: amino acid ABC transporter substrate-binding protein [Methylocystaceae bacterium]|nr:amino acid ABC transporter substrate-binding protein [Methylocystaceae bacterium]
MKKLKKYFFWLVFTAFSLCVLNPLQAADYKVAVTLSSVPFSYKNDQGQLVGFNVDIAQEICKRLKVSCEIIPIRFSNILTKVHQAEIDFALSNMLKTPERLAKAAFTIPYWRSTSSFVGPVEYSFGSIKRVIATEKICAVQTSRQLGYLQNKSIADERLVVTKTGNDTIAAMKEGRCTLYLLPTMQSFSFLQSDAGRGYGYLGKPIFDKGLGGDVHMIVRPDRPELLKQINDVLKSIIEDGTHNEITKRYFPIGIL